MMNSKMESAFFSHSYRSFVWVTAKHTHIGFNLFAFTRRKFYRFISIYFVYSFAQSFASSSIFISFSIFYNISPYLPKWNGRERERERKKMRRIRSLVWTHDKNNVISYRYVQFNLKFSNLNTSILSHVLTLPFNNSRESPRTMPLLLVCSLFFFVRFSRFTFLKSDKRHCRMKWSNPHRPWHCFSLPAWFSLTDYFGLKNSTRRIIFLLCKKKNPIRHREQVREWKRKREEEIESISSSFNFSVEKMCKLFAKQFHRDGNMALFLSHSFHSLLSLSTHLNCISLIN